LANITLKIEKQRQCLLQSLDAAHATFYRTAPFGGPSLHFHLRALEAAKAPDFEKFVEYAYAMLVAWGMHRMGGGARMCDFEEFRTSLKSLWPTILRLRDATPEDIDDLGWREMKEVFYGIRCMATKASLVGNSKVMAHALPNLVAPVDRHYTLRFLFGNKNNNNQIEREWERLQVILAEFFYPVLDAEPFKLRRTEWGKRHAEFRWDTSPLKIVDNLVIGFLKQA
jgi:hypothetical protein